MVVINIKYCRYCAFCISGDAYYCTCYDKVLNNVNRVTSCSEFVLSELGDVDTGKPYKPRDFSDKVSVQKDTRQITFFGEDDNG